jgi:rhodanese-related sulfurtransferase
MSGILEFPEILSRYAKFLLKAAFVTAAVCSTKWLEASQEHGHQSEDQRSLSRVECGLYSLAAAARSLKIEFNVLSLMNGEYVVPASGSSMSQLARAARDNGFCAYPVRNVGPRFLVNTEWPLLLNLSNPVSEECPGHWVAFLGEHDGKAMVFDLAQTPKLSSWNYGDLLYQMSGDAMIVARNRIGIVDVLSIKLGGMRRYLPLMLLVMIGLLFRRWACHSMARQVLVIALVAATWSATEFSGRFGFGSNRGAVAWIKSKFVLDGIHGKVTLDQVTALRLRPDVVIVDARTKGQYEYGHIPGAVHLGIDLGCENFILEAERYRDRNLMIVYCNDSKCRWSKTIANRLTAADFDNVRVFEGGLDSWNEQSSPIGQ